jgi:hypothetical protein
MVFIEEALVKAVIAEAKKDPPACQLLEQNLTLDTDHNVPPSPLFWSAGSIVAAVLNCAQKVVTPILCIGAYQGNRFGVTLEAVPRAIIVTQDDVTPKEVKLAKNAGTLANRTKDYIASILRTTKQMMNVVPLRPDQVPLFFDDNNNPKTVRELAKVFERFKEPTEALVKTWLRAALVAQGTTENADSVSQLQIEPDMPATFSLEQSETFYTDIKIGFHETDHLFGTTVANGLLNCLHNTFTPALEPETENIDEEATAGAEETAGADDTRRTRPRPAATTANDALLQRILQMEEQLAVQQATIDTHQQERRQPPPTGTATQQAFRTTASIGGGTVNPFTMPNIPGTLGSQAGPQNNISQRLQEFADKALAGNITQDDMNTFQVLKTMQGANPSTAQPHQKDNLGTRLFNLCGWAQLSPNELHHLHQDNDNAWIRYNNATNSKDRLAVVEAYFIQPLIKQQPRFRQILTTELRDIIANWNLAPKNYDGSKPHGGLGPLTFVTRSVAEQENIEYFRNINSLAKDPTTADIERTLPGTPEIPDNVDALITVLTLTQLALVMVIGRKALPSKDIFRLITALHENYNRLKGLHNFQARISNEVIYQLCRHLARYFNNFCTEAAVQAKEFPPFNIDFLIQGIENNNLSMSISYGPIFAPKRTPTQPQAPNRANNRNAAPSDPTSRKRDRSQRPAPSARAARPTERTGPGLADIKKVVAAYKTKNGKPLRLSDIRTANDFATNKDLCAAVGSAYPACVPWVLYGSCSNPSCRHPHQENFTAFKHERALAIIVKATST